MTYQQMRDSKTRYDAIARHLVGNVKPMDTVLDFGCYGSYFGVRLAEEFALDVTGVDDQPFLYESYQLPSDGRYRLIPTRMTPSDLHSFQGTKVVLALSVLHHQEDWQDYLDALVDISEFLFVENADHRENLHHVPAQRRWDIDQAIAERFATPLCETPGYDQRYRRTLYVIE